MTDTDVHYVRRMTNELDDTHYTDDAIQQLIDSYGVTSTIVRIWRDRAARFSALSDVSDSGASAKMSQLHEHALKQLSYWEGVLQREDSGRRTRVAKIVRSDYDAG